MISDTMFHKCLSIQIDDSMHFTQYNQFMTTHYRSYTMKCLMIYHCICRIVHSLVLQYSNVCCTLRRHLENTYY